MDALRILVADDDAVGRRLLAATLSRMGHDVVATADGTGAWAMVQARDINLVIADWEMPGLDGLGLTRRIRAARLDRYVYVILLTARSGKQDVVAGLEAGADDYVTKPFDRAELEFRIHSGCRIVALERELAEKNRQLAETARVDGLTGVLNRRALDEALPRVHRHARRGGRPYGVAMIDVDLFKRYNDEHGHAAGDAILQAVASLLVDSLRPSDLVFRYGGDEFVCVMPDTSVCGTLAAARRVRQAAATLWVAEPVAGGRRGVTLSIGVATYEPGDGTDPDHVLASADRALLDAKRRGRDTIAVMDACTTGPAAVAAGSG